MKMVLDEFDLVDEHLDVLDLGVLDYLNSATFHKTKKSKENVQLMLIKKRNFVHIT